MNLATYITQPAIPYLHMDMYSWDRESTPLYNNRGDVVSVIRGMATITLTGEASEADCAMLEALIGKGLSPVTVHTNYPNVDMEYVVKLSIIDVHVEITNDTMKTVTVKTDQAEMEDYLHEFSIQNQ